MAYKAEYIWVDGTEPTAKLRSKTKIIADGVPDLPMLISDMLLSWYRERVERRPDSEHRQALLRVVREAVTRLVEHGTDAAWTLTGSGWTLEGTDPRDVEVARPW